VTVHPEDFDSAVPAPDRIALQEKTEKQPETPLAEKSAGSAAPNKRPLLWQLATVVAVGAFAAVLMAYLNEQQKITTALSEEEQMRVQLDEERRQLESRVEVTRVWADYNVSSENNQNGMLVHVKFAANNLRCEPLQAVVFFYFENGSHVQGALEGFKASDGTLAVWQDFSPDSQSAVWEDLRMFLPYGAMELPPGQSELKYSVLIRRREGDAKVFATSTMDTFRINH
jgi:hypothetical protein